MVLIKNTSVNSEGNFLLGDPCTVEVCWVIRSWTAVHDLIMVSAGLDQMNLNVACLLPCLFLMLFCAGSLHYSDGL